MFEVFDLLPRERLERVLEAIKDDKMTSGEFFGEDWGDGPLVDPLAAALSHDEATKFREEVWDNNDPESGVDKLARTLGLEHEQVINFGQEWDVDFEAATEATITKLREYIEGRLANE